jgi:hypothetical protein
MTPRWAGRRTSRVPSDFKEIRAKLNGSGLMIT